jgi:hypothetical protein
MRLRVLLLQELTTSKASFIGLPEVSASISIVAATDISHVSRE